MTKRSKSNKETASSKELSSTNPTTPPRTIVTNSNVTGHDEPTVLRSGNPSKQLSKTTSKIPSARSSLSPSKQPLLDEKLKKTNEALTQEKAGKRKLFHSLVKLANELKRTREHAQPILDRQTFEERPWHEGGFWRAPLILPGVSVTVADTKTQTGQRQDVSLSELFLNLVVVLAFTRVGVAIGEHGSVDMTSLLYFAVVWNIWNKDLQYSTRFDTSDVSAQLVTFVTCIAVLLASFSAKVPLNSAEATYIMGAASLVAILHALLHIRTLTANFADHHAQVPLATAAVRYSVFTILIAAAETIVWLAGAFFFPVNFRYRWSIFATGVVLGLRIPRVFLANDFNADCSKRGVLYTVLLGCVLHNVIAVASEFLDFQSPATEHYFFIGATCLLLFCLKSVYVNDVITMAQDHALLINKWSAFLYSLGDFFALLSTTALGSGLNLLTHKYLSTSTSNHGTSNRLICGGFAVMLLSTLFTKSFHLKRLPANARHRLLYLGAYFLHGFVLLLTALSFGSIGWGFSGSGLLRVPVRSEMHLLLCASGAALLLIVLGWLDKVFDLFLYESIIECRALRVQPHGFWGCIKPKVDNTVLTPEQIEAEERADSVRKLSVLSPLLGSPSSDSSGNYMSFGADNVGIMV